MIRDILLMLVSIVLTFGFYTKELDWLLIYWGCAPKEKRAKMNEKAIHLTAWVSCLILAFMFALNVFLRLIDFDTMIYYMEIVETIVFILMILVTSTLALYNKDK